MGKQNLSKSSKSVRSLGMQIEDGGASSEASKFQREGVNPSFLNSPMIYTCKISDHCMESHNSWDSDAKHELQFSTTIGKTKWLLLAVQGLVKQ